MDNRATGCGENLGNGRRGLPAMLGMRSRLIEMLHPFGDSAAGMVDVEEQALL